LRWGLLDPVALVHDLFPDTSDPFTFHEGYRVYWYPARLARQAWAAALEVWGLRLALAVAVLWVKRPPWRILGPTAWRWLVLPTGLAGAAALVTLDIPRGPGASRACTAIS
jgi:hypothetical protein